MYADTPRLHGSSETGDSALRLGTAGGPTAELLRASEAALDAGATTAASALRFAEDGATEAMPDDTDLLGDTAGGPTAEPVRAIDCLGAAAKNRESVFALPSVTVACFEVSHDAGVSSTLESAGGGAGVCATFSGVITMAFAVWFPFG